MIQLDGELRRTMAGDDCVACCTSTMSERNTSWQQTQNKSLYEGLGFLGTWNSQTEDKFSKCNVTTTESVISSSDEQLFISWGLVMAVHPDYCSRACNSSAKAMTILHESVLQQLMASQKKAVGDMTSDIEEDVIRPGQLFGGGGGGGGPSAVMGAIQEIITLGAKEQLGALA